MAAATFRRPIDDWTGPGGNALYQGKNKHRQAGVEIDHQADDVAGQAQQNVIFRQKLKDGRVVTNTVPRAGHGSSTGLVETDDDSCEIWLGHDGQGCSGFVRLDIGRGGTLTFVPTALPEGDIEIDQDNNILVLRNGNRYRVYELDTVRRDGARNRVKIADFTIPAWGKRWQGMFVVEGRLLVHRDVKTKGASRAHMFDLRGRPVNFPASPLTKNTAQNWIDTTGMGDEAEGFHVEYTSTQVFVYVVKRTGPLGSKRYIQGRLVLTLPKARPEPKPWDGKSFPGAAAFRIGQSHPAVTLLDERLIKWGFTKHKAGATYQAGPRFSENTRLNVQEAQLAFGFEGTQLGGGADGYAGPSTWTRLMADPPPPPVVVPPTTPEDSVQIVSRKAWRAKPWAGQPASVAMSEKRHFLVHYHGGMVHDQFGLDVPLLIDQIHRANGWSGIGYNFAVDMDGVAYEGRGWGLVGAHCPGRNRDGIGVYVAVGGNQVPTAAALATVRALYAEANRRAGRTLEKCYHSKHYATECPGDYLRAWVDKGMPAAGGTPPPAVEPKPPVVSKPDVEAPVTPEPASSPFVPVVAAQPIVTDRQAITTGFKVPGSWAWKKHPGHDWNRVNAAGQLVEDRGLGVVAPVTGKVVSGSWGGDYGNHVIIEDATGVRTGACHLTIKTAKVGQKVLAGKTSIGTVGTTGNSSGPHVHVESRQAPYGYGDQGVVTPRYDAVQPSTKVIRVQDLRKGLQPNASAYWTQTCLNAISLSGGKNCRLTGLWTEDNVAEVKKLQAQKFGDEADGALGIKQATAMVELARIAGLTVEP